MSTILVSKTFNIILNNPGRVLYAGYVCLSLFCANMSQLWPGYGGPCGYGMGMVGGPTHSEVYRICLSVTILCQYVPDMA